MARIKRGVTAKARHKKVLALAKGYRGRSSDCSPPGAAAGREGRCSTPIATGATASAISARCGSSGSTPRRAPKGLTYGRLIFGLKTAGIELDRKVLADIAVRDPTGFRSLAPQAKSALEA